MPGRGHPRRGSALPVALIFAVLLASLAFFLLGPIRVGRELELQEGQRVAAHHLTRGGLEAALHLLRLNPREPLELSFTAGSGQLQVRAVPVRDLEACWLVQITVLQRGPGGGTETVSYVALRLGASPPGGGLAPVRAWIWGRTPQVVDGLRD